MESMNSDQPRVALLGYGYWGPNLARNLHMGLGRDWVACVDPDPARRAEVARRYPWVRALADPAEVMADPEVDALVVASPARTHAPLVIDALQAGKHVLVEKPLACRPPRRSAWPRPPTGRAGSWPWATPSSTTRP